MPCLGLFTQTDPARYGCLGAQHLNLVIEDRNAIPLDQQWLTEALASAPHPVTMSVSPTRYLPATRPALLPL